MITNFLPAPDTMDRLAWTLAHFLWQGSLVAILSAGALRILQRRSAESRYAASVAALVLMVAAPVATFFWDPPKAVTAPMNVRLASTAEAPVLPSHPATPTSGAWTEWVVLAWFAGVAACSIRLAAGWHLTRQMIRSADSSTPREVSTQFDTMVGGLDLTRPVRLLVSGRIDSPVAVGWLRPAVLLPVTALTGLDADQLRAVLAHELAHIRRHDFAVNLLQRCVESLLFYHPAVWWLSARIRAEREHCCDDLAVRVCGDPVTYARALVELERFRAGDPALAMAATGGDLGRRVRRILNRDAAGSEWMDGAAVSALVVAMLVAGALDWNTLWAQEPPPPPPAPPVAAAPARPPAPPPPPPAPVAMAAMPAPPPPPPPPAQASGRSFRVSRFDDDAWVLFRGGTVMMSGSSGDEAEARITRRSIGGDLLWMRVDGKTYVVSDKATLDRIAALYEPMEKLGEQQRELGQQQRVLGEEQRKLGQQQRQVRVSVPDLQADIDRIKADLKADATQEELSRLQSRIGELQSRIGRLQGQAGNEQSKIGQQQSELGRKQSELGRQQSELGRQQSEIAEKADKQVRELLREAVKTRRAKPIV